MLQKYCLFRTESKRSLLTPPLYLPSFLRYFQNDGSGQQVRCSCLDQPFVAKGAIPPQPDPQYRSFTARLAAGSGEKPKRRRRRPEERKNRGRTGTGGGRRLASACPAVRLPPLMPPALGLLPSDHVLLVRVCTSAKNPRSIINR